MLYSELRLKVPLLLGQTEIESLFSKAEKVLGLDETDRLVSVVSVGPKAMRKINLESRGRDEATDVLSFSLEEKDSFVVAPYVNLFFGEIIICPAVAARRAKSRGLSKSEYQRLLLVHGLLHLFNFDHQNVAAAAKMEQLEKKILNL